MLRLTLKYALRNKDDLTEIPEILVGSIFEKLQEKSNYYDDIINSLET